MRLPVNHALPLAALVILAGCGLGGGEDRPARVAVPASGPAADFPMVIGEPFTIDGVTHRPEDRLNYDAVGYAALGGEGGERIAVAHKTLPVPSYVEVTALDSGKTILARVERRGPMSNDQLVELSPGAAAQLGLVAAARPPVRVRRVNPPEPERALLRTGQRAPERMDTPKPLAAVLMRRLQGQGTVAPAPAATPSPAVAAAPPPRPKPAPQTTPAPTPVPVATQAPQPVSTAGSLVVQAGAFSSASRAAAVAKAVGGRVESAGSLHRVRIGPFTSRAEAEAALAKARAAGYTDARIQRAD